MSSSISTPSIAPKAESVAPAGVANTTASKPKPCCVCKDEKALRDDCMLFSTSTDPASNDCKPIIDQYKTCMAGYGFKI
ncbi:cytochrome C oxidase copper chaperone-domain-containing protein [Xylaria sp. FL1042]|nr:cytochrome C oxidase copper chaperone-domain-containing protein [Xylaria sp. FL1042]